VLDPLRANSYVSFGQMLYVAGRYDEARAALQQALGLNPLATYAHVILSQILIAQGKPQQALAEIEKEPNEGENSLARYWLITRSAVNRTRMLL
jgi:tetratricopeptide (TPR) repeat protein